MDNQNLEENENLNLEGQNNPEGDEFDENDDQGASPSGDRELSDQESPEKFNWPELEFRTDKFKMPENGDPKSFHIILQQGGFDTETGKALHKAHPSTHNPIDFKLLLGNARGLGYNKIIITHVPEGYSDFQKKWTQTPKGSGTASY